MDLTSTPIMRTEEWWNEIDVNDVFDTSVENILILLRIFSNLLIISGYYLWNNL